VARRRGRRGTSLHLQRRLHKSMPSTVQTRAIFERSFRGQASGFAKSHQIAVSGALVALYILSVGLSFLIVRRKEEEALGDPSSSRLFGSGRPPGKLDTQHRSAPRAECSSITNACAPPGGERRTDGSLRSMARGLPRESRGAANHHFCALVRANC